MAGALAFLKTVRKNNPAAKIVWILPATDCHPELAQEAVEKARAEGMENLFTCALPDYGREEDLGARWHPNAEYNRRAGRILADYLRENVL